MRLKYAEDDARVMDRILSSPPFDFHVEAIPPETTGRDFRFKVANFFQDLGKEDVALVYVSCHGVLTKHGLMLVSNEYEQSKGFTTGCFVDELVKYVDMSNAAHKMLVLDCCHAGAVKPPSGAKGDFPDLELMLKGSSSLILAAAKKLEFARELDELSASFLRYAFEQIAQDIPFNAFNASSAVLRMSLLAMSFKEKVPKPHLIGTSNPGFPLGIPKMLVAVARVELSSSDHNASCTIHVGDELKVKIVALDIKDNVLDNREVHCVVTPRDGVLSMQYDDVAIAYRPGEAHLQAEVGGVKSNKLRVLVLPLVVLQGHEDTNTLDIAPDFEGNATGNSVQPSRLFPILTQHPKKIAFIALMVFLVPILIYKDIVSKREEDTYRIIASKHAYANALEESRNTKNLSKKISKELKHIEDLNSKIPSGSEGIKLVKEEPSTLENSYTSPTKKSSEDIKKISSKVRSPDKSLPISNVPTRKKVVDSDGDGINDHKDACPLEVETYNGNEDDDGCPDGDQTVVIIKTEITLLEKVFFDTGKATIQKSYGLLDTVAIVLNQNPQITRIRVEGHTDDTESQDRKLSLQRAMNVQKHLIEQGVKAKRIEILAYDDTQPRCAELSEQMLGKPSQDYSIQECRVENRRVEFKVIELNGKSIEPKNSVTLEKKRLFTEPIR